MNIYGSKLAHNKRPKEDPLTGIRNTDKKKTQQKEGRVRRISRQARADSRETTCSQETVWD